MLRLNQCVSFGMVLATQVILGAGCGDVPESEESQLSAVTEAAGPGGGLHREMVQSVMSKLELRPDQRTALQGLLQRVHAQAAPLRRAHAEVISELAREVRSGSIDRVKLEPLMKRAMDLAPTIRPVMLASVAQLHQTLDRAQREKLVDLIKQRGPGHRGLGHRGRFGGALVKRLGLTDDQRDRLMDLGWDTLKAHHKEMRGRRQEMKRKVEQAAEAFVSDKFDPSQLPLFSDLHQAGQMRGQIMIQLLQQGLPILTSEQRTKLADLLDARTKIVTRTEW